MPDPLKVLTTIRRATALVRATPGRSGGIITLEKAAEVMVVGDLHGNISAFKKVLALVGPRSPSRPAPGIARADPRASHVSG